ncbi:hypothetical protein MWU57_05600 [Isoptericola sp. S6320L]|uniref:DUF4097 family beta strand repeat-containing protein n=1 Tax=Isoptericola sp. S6320L TaxID=2926411 RepID=UPI001FF2CCD0|nr:hypothetical protein [Isoptericola sp. S6320L]MCK0116499.1 hypothetical protein [Isoptericola sp. S6320L]
MTTSTPDLAPAEPAPGGSPPAPRGGPRGRVLLTVGLALGGLLVAWAALHLVDWGLSSTTTTREDYDATAALDLVAGGDVEVRADDAITGIEVEVVARGGLVSPRYAVEQVGDRLVLTNECPAWAWFSWVCSGELHAVVPPATAVQARTGNGDVWASGLDADTELRSANGEVVAGAIGGDLEARSANGDLSLHEIGGDVDARSANGEVEVERVEGRVSAVSSNGDVEVFDVGEGVLARTSNGSVDVSAVGGDVVARSSNGSVTVIGDGEPVALTIGTSNGSETVEGDTDPSATRTVEVRSSNGDVAYLGP